MRVEVDQSGKIGDTKVPTVLAFSNGESRAILIPATVKRACIHILREQGKTGTTMYIRLFSIGLYLLLREYIHNMEKVLIDVEYPGHDAKIKQHLLNLFRRSQIAGVEHKIDFHFVGKESNSHDKAISVFNRSVPPDRIITLKEITAEF